MTSQRNQKTLEVGAMQKSRSLEHAIPVDQTLVQELQPSKQQIRLPPLPLVIDINERYFVCISSSVSPR